MRVTDNTEFKYAATPQFRLTGQPGLGQESMGFVLLGAQDKGVLYLSGY